MTSHRSTQHGGVNLHVYPSTLVNSSRVFKLARSLQAELGFSETHAVGIHTGDLPVSEEIAPRTIVRRLAGSGRRGNLGRILKVLLWQPRVYREYRDACVTVVAAHNVWVLPLCARIARRTGAVLVYNPHELETETVAMRGLKQKLARWVERRYIRRVKLCSTVNESIAAWYAHTYRIRPPVAVTNIPVDDPPQPPRVRERLGIEPTRMLYVHTGHLAPGRNIPLILHTFTRLPDHHLLMIGDGVLLPLVREAVRRHPNIHWLPPVEPGAVVAYVREADVGLCLIEGTSRSLQLSTPNKLFEALASGTPCLITDLVEARRVLGAGADRWTVRDPAHELESTVRGITDEDVAAFAASWPGLRTWEAEVAPLIQAYRDAIAGN